MTDGLAKEFEFDNSFARDLVDLYEPWQPAPGPSPVLLALNDPLAAELGIDPVALRSASGVAMLAGNAVPKGAAPLAQAYAGHQFGGYSPRLGDGRALLLGEVLDRHGRRRDLHMKGSGRTPFSRGGDGKAAVGPMLREYVIGEALHALGIPATRALSVVATGEWIRRERPLPGAVLMRVASSHLRVGTFQYAAASSDLDRLRRLADYAIARHYPAVTAADNPYVALLDAVIGAQAALVSQWMLVGFIHGVMNTDNMTISGEAIDFGPCAFMDSFDPSTVFSSIDHGGRYAYGNQPAAAQWNLARLAETLLPLIDSDTERAVEIATNSIGEFAGVYNARWTEGMAAKLGLDAAPDHAALIDDFVELLTTQRADFTTSFRALADWLRGQAGPALASFDDAAAFHAWAQRWRDALGSQDHRAVADAMDRRNPLYIARNHAVEGALTAATAGDLDPFNRLVAVLTRPFDAQSGADEYARPAPPSFAGYQTFCGT